MSVFKHWSQIQEGTFDIDAYTVEAITVEYDLPISDFVDALQDARQEAALVCRDGQWVGYATSTDAFESVLGQLEDPFD